MDISSITTQPNFAGDLFYLVAAYRQIYFVVKADSVVPANQPMYADIYFAVSFDPTYLSTDYTFYKTISSYSIDNDGSGHSEFAFDIQDACQEFLTTFIPSSLAAWPLRTNDNEVSSISCQVYFRGSSIVSNILVPNPTVPVQATYTTAATSPYSGTAANPIVVCNASILPSYGTIYQNAYANYLSGGEITDIPATGISSNPFISDTEIYSLSNLPINRYQSYDVGLCPESWEASNGVLGVLVQLFGTSGALARTSRLCEMYLVYGSNGAMTVYIKIVSAFTWIAGSYYVPVGLSLLKPLLDAVDPMYYPAIVNPTNTNYYRIVVYDTEGDAICWASPLYKVCTTTPETTTLWFQNMHGHFEHFTFSRYDETYNTKSSTLFTPYTEAIVNPNNTLAVGIKRYQVRSNDEISLTVTINEQLMPWLKQLFSSPYILKQNTEPHAITFTQMVMLDGSLNTKKTITKAGIRYTFTMKLRPSIDPIQLRN